MPLQDISRERDLNTHDGANRQSRGNTRDSIGESASMDE